MDPRVQMTEEERLAMEEFWANLADEGFLTGAMSRRPHPRSRLGAPMPSAPMAPGEDIYSAYARRAMENGAYPETHPSLQGRQPADIYESYVETHPSMYGRDPRNQPRPRETHPSLQGRQPEDIMIPPETHPGAPAYMRRWRRRDGR